MNRFVLGATALLVAASAHAQERGAAALGRLVDGLGTSARVLIVGAHPDDEDTRLIAWLAKGRHAETAYLSLTRGDGGQNLIGNELGEVLGAIRTEELIAARRLDGGRQYFGRAYDFGFSKSAEDAFRHWPRDEVLGDAVRVVRAFRPDVVIAIFTGTPEDGHGQHQASGIVAREAYDASADTVRFPRATFGAPWAVPKFYRARSYRNHAGATLRYNAGAYDPLSGRSFAELAAESRTQHKSQGQGGLERKGVSVVSLRREATRVNANTPAEAERDLFDGIDTTAAGALARAGCRAPGVGDAVAATIGAAQRAHDVRRPDALVAPLGAVLGAVDRAIAACASAGHRGPLLEALFERANEALALALGVAVEAEVTREIVAPGDTVRLRITAYNRGARAITVSGGLPERATAMRAPIAPDSSHTWTEILTGPPISPARPRIAGVSDISMQPWWLATPRVGSMYSATTGIGRDETREDGFAVTVAASVPGVPGATTMVRAPVVFRVADPVKGDVRRPLAVAPAVSVTLDHPVQYARANTPFARTLRVRLRSASTAPRDVTVRLELPDGLAADSAQRRVTLPRHDAQADVTFRLRGTLAPGEHAIRAVAESDGERFTQGYQLVDYDHIRPLRVYRPAETRVAAVSVALPPRVSVGYVQGVGDNVAPMLADLGIPVTTLDPAAVATTDLSRFTAIVIGNRAYDASDALVAQNPWLFAWARNGGTLVVQGGQQEMQRPGVMPFPLAVAQPTVRVTQPDAPVTVLDSTSTSVLASPNRVTAADFAGWVQERTRYMPRSFDPAYRAILAMSDPGEPPNPGALLVAPLGRGTYVYSTLSFFRQLPAGNPGAARLFVNLLAARARPLQ